MTQPCPHDLAERETSVYADGYCPLCMAHELTLLRARDIGWSMQVEETWNDAIEAAAQRANAAFLIDPLTSPAEAIRGLRKP